MILSCKHIDNSLFYNYGINIVKKNTYKNQIIDFYNIEQLKLKNYDFYLTTDSPLNKCPIQKNRNNEFDFGYMWSTLPEENCNVFEKQISWHLSRKNLLNTINFNISCLSITPHGIFLYSIGKENLYINKNTISNIPQIKSKKIKNNFYYQVDIDNNNLIEKYKI